MINQNTATSSLPGTTILPDTRPPYELFPARPMSSPAVKSDKEALLTYRELFHSSMAEPNPLSESYCQDVMSPYNVVVTSSPIPTARKTGTSLNTVLQPLIQPPRPLSRLNSGKPLGSPPSPGPWMTSPPIFESNTTEPGTLSEEITNSSPHLSQESVESGSMDHQDQVNPIVYRQPFLTRSLKTHPSGGVDMTVKRRSGSTMLTPHNPVGLPDSSRSGVTDIPSKHKRKGVALSFDQRESLSQPTTPSKLWDSSPRMLTQSNEGFRSS